MGGGRLAGFCDIEQRLCLSLALWNGRHPILKKRAFLARLYGAAPVTPYPKDGINDHVIHGTPTVNPVGVGTKCAFWYPVTVQPGQTAQLRLRLRAAGGGKQRAKAQADPLGVEFGQVLAQRRVEADEFYAELTPAGASADEALVLR